MSSKTKVLSLYKQLIKESKKFPSYNYRHYAIRKTRDEFKGNKEIVEPQKIQELLKKGQDNLEIIQRQVLIGQMYDGGHLVIENDPQKT